MCLLVFVCVGVFASFVFACLCVFAYVPQRFIGANSSRFVPVCLVVFVRVSVCLRVCQLLLFEPRAKKHLFFSSQESLEPMVPAETGFASVVTRRNWFARRKNKPSGQVFLVSSWQY